MTYIRNRYATWRGLFMADMPQPPRNFVLYIMLAVLIWGGLLALGAYLYGGARPAMKAAWILSCVLAFLGLWGALLKYRSAVHGGRSPDDDSSADSKRRS